MHAFCYHFRVPNVQIRDVPPDVHRRLKAQATQSGQSLNAYLLAQVTEIARLPTVAELADRIRARPPYTGPSAAGVVREDRDSR